MNVLRYMESENEIGKCRRRQESRYKGNMYKRVCLHACKCKRARGIKAGKKQVKAKLQQSVISVTAESNLLQGMQICLGGLLCLILLEYIQSLTLLTLFSSTRC